MMVPVLDRDQLRAKLAGGQPFKLVMVASDFGFRTKHIPGSVHVMTHAKTFPALAKDDDIVVYCSNVDCLSSVALYRDLIERGYGNVRRYAGGLIDWEDAGLPLEGAFVGAT